MPAVVWMSISCSAAGSVTLVMGHDRSDKAGRAVMQVSRTRHAVVVAVLVLVGLGISGYMVFTNAKVDELQHADAITVLGGDHDGRED